MLHKVIDTIRHTKSVETEFYICMQRIKVHTNTYSIIYKYLLLQKTLTNFSIFVQENAEDKFECLEKLLCVFCTF